MTSRERLIEIVEALPDDAVQAMLRHAQTLRTGDEGLEAALSEEEAFWESLAETSPPTHYRFDRDDTYRERLDLSR